MSDPIPALTLHELGLCIVVFQITRTQIEGAPDGEDYIPDLATITTWLEAAVPNLSDEQQENIAATLETLFDADILEKDFVHGSMQFHLTDLGERMMHEGVRRRVPGYRGRPEDTERDER